MQSDFWAAVDQLVQGKPVIVDRPQGSAHPRFPEIIYPLDYGYLDGTRGGDGAEIDVWLGPDAREQVTAAVCTVDVRKGDSEVKFLLGCSRYEIQTILDFYRANEMGCWPIYRE
ncbi:MAG: inorganic pyrophosphatase [Anaerolineae bacterium]|nr:inorganic pyrophosphatase [Anaerolineae bacterium]